MKYSFTLFLLLLIISCNGQKASNTEQNQNGPATFQMISIPQVLTQPEERAGYLVEHYWDNLNFNDTTYLEQPNIIEQAFADYIDVLPYVSLEKASSSIKSMLKQAEANKRMYTYFTELYEKYLYDPNSPMRNEEFFIPVLQSITTSPILEEVDKIRPAHLLEMALKNRVGQKAIDFKYTLNNGKQALMHEIKSDYLLIYFYNPDCQNCKLVFNQLINSSIINKLTKEKRFTALALYPDEDLQAWKEHLSSFPKDWINSYDKEISIRNNELYDIKAIPTLYLLDKNKNVLLKDVTFEQLEQYFLQLSIL